MVYNLLFLVLVGLFIVFMYLLMLLNMLLFDVNLNFFSDLKLNGFWNVNYLMGLDGLSILFSLLVIILLVICVMNYKYVVYSRNWYFMLMGLSLFIFLELFLTQDILTYFFFFELSALPMYLMISIWGSSESKVYAGNLLIMYTMMGSLFLLTTMYMLYIYVGTLNFNSLYYYSFDVGISKLMFFLIFLSFSIKMPMVPLHLWLTEAHVEAMTPGSVLLAGMVLKLALYMYISVMYNFSDNYMYVMSMAFMTYYMPSLLAMVQFDLKKVMAYASMSHMGFTLFGLFSNNIMGVKGAVFMLFGHALVASALFLTMGSLYERYKTSNIFYYGGLSLLMPMWCVFLFVYMLGNMGFPGTVNFAAELMMFYGGFVYSKVFMILAFVGMVLPLLYSFWLYMKLVYGSMSVEFMKKSGDMSSREFFYLFVLVFLVMYLGLVPQELLQNLVYLNT